MALEQEDKPARRGRPRSAASEAAILESAYRLTAADGLAATTIDAIARDSQVSKMTIYKWWPSREALLIDAFLRQAAQMLPLPEQGDPPAILREHAAAYAEALLQDFGKVQLAVIAECVANTGSAAIFSERYLALRREIAVKLIRRGQKEGSIAAPQAAGDLYDRIYGTLFYQFVFGFRRLSRSYARQLVNEVLGAD
ncbi:MULTISPECIES: TetR/AcrR family transcriptional regulator [Cupriavidus]